MKYKVNYIVYPQLSGAGYREIGRTKDMTSSQNLFSYFDTT